jgi:hypothetical protein
VICPNQDEGAPGPSLLGTGVGGPPQAADQRSTKGSRLR